MNTLVANITLLVLLPSAIVTGFLYVIVRLLDAWLDGRTVGATTTSLAAFGVGAYFLGHPLYPQFVPLIRASTPWLYAVGGVYLTLGVASIGASLVGTCALGVPSVESLPAIESSSAVWPWLAAALAVAVGVFAANGFRLASLVHFDGTVDIAAPLYVAVTLALLFPLGRASRLGDRRRSVRPLGVAFVTYALVLANSIPLTSRVRGPVGVVFVAFGCVGVFVGIPAYLLGTTLGASTERETSATD